MTLALQLTVAGFAVGLLYGLMAVGLTIVYNASGVLNLAQGAYTMLGGMLTYRLITTDHLPMAVADIVSIVLVALVGAATYFLVIAPLMWRGAELSVIVLATIGVQFIAEDFALHFFGGTTVSFNSFTTGPPLTWGPISLSQGSLWVLVGSVITLGLLYLLFSRTRIGIAARAAAFDDVAARLVGIRVNRIVLASWALSGAIGALAGILLTPVQADSYNVSFGFLVTAFAAALVGGLGNVVGAMIAGIALGIVESVSLLFISTTAQDAIAFGLIVVVLVVRPKGLFKPSFEKQLN